MENTKILTNPYDLIQWVKTDPNTECMLLDLNAPFLEYRTGGKPQLRAKALSGHTTKNKSVPYGIQQYAWVELGKNEYVSQRRFSTTCGNPLCMNPKHIIPQDVNADNNTPVKGSVTKLNQYREVMRLSANGLTPKEIASMVAVCEGTVHKYRAQMIEDLLGEDYKWSDLITAINVADGMRWAQQRRAKSPKELLMENLKQND